MKILFFSVTKHQYRYFEKLKQNLPFYSKHIFFPTLSLSFKGLLFTKEIDIEDIFTLKIRELDSKYKHNFQKNAYKLLLKIQIPLVVSSIYKQIELYNPDFVVFWNGKKFHQAIALKVVQKFDIKSIFFENGLLPDTTTMDFQGVNASNSMPRTLAFYKNLEFRKDYALPSNLQERKSKKEMISFDKELPANFIFIPFQVAYDTQVIQHSPWIKDMRLFYELISYLAKDVDISFVIKEHPSDRVSDYSDLFARENKKIFFSSENTQKLIENASAVMTINSTVAIEALLFKKRVIVLGEAFFAIDGIVKTADDKESVLKILQDLESWQVDDNVIDNFLKYLKFEYLIPANWRTPTKNHFDKIAEKLKSEY